jgi:hypothetical protein
MNENTVKEKKKEKKRTHRPASYACKRTTLAGAATGAGPGLPVGVRVSLHFGVDRRRIGAGGRRRAVVVRVGVGYAGSGSALGDEVGASGPAGGAAGSHGGGGQRGGGANLFLSLGQAQEGGHSIHMECHFLGGGAQRQH